MQSLTQANVSTTLRNLGIVIRKRDGEYRVNFKGGSEATAYYTDDIQDALDTGKMMAQLRKDGLAAY